MSFVPQGQQECTFSMQSTGDKGKAGERRLVFGCGRQFVHVKEMRIIVVVGGGGDSDWKHV